MEPIYITGHRNPDTDSIVAAISYAVLKNALGERAYIAARIGELSDQTEMLLQKFDFPAPKLLHTVRTQVSDLDYDTPPILSAAVSVYHAWQTLATDTLVVPTLPVTDEDGRLYGMLTPEEIESLRRDKEITGKWMMPKTPTIRVRPKFDSRFLVSLYNPFRKLPGG